MGDFHLRRNVRILSRYREKSISDLTNAIKSLNSRRLHLSGVHERQIFADTFVKMGGTKAIVSCLIYIRSILDAEDSTRLDSRIMDFCVDASHESVKFCVSIGEAGLLHELANDLYKMKPTYKRMSNHGLHEKVLASISILMNCARSAETKGMLRKMCVWRALDGYCKAGTDVALSATATMALSFIRDIPWRISDNILLYLTSLLESCTKNKKHTATITYCCVASQAHAFELLKSLIGMARHPENKEFLVDSGITPQITWLLQNGDDRERELAANLLWRLVTERNWSQIAETEYTQETWDELQHCGSQVVEYAATRASITLLNQGSRRPRTQCTQRRVAKRFLHTVVKFDIDVFFEKSFDLCFCAVCHATRGDDLYYSRGEPAMDHGLPIGWYRFGLKVPHRANARGVDALNKWHRCFHGTRTEAIQHILETGDLLLPGDVGLGGEAVGERPGHFTSDWKPEGFDTKQVFLSPSIRYAGNPTYAKKSLYTSKQTGKSYQAQVAFQVLIRPGSYKTGVQTIGADHDIDPHFSNQDIEWSTKERGAVILYGLLVKLKRR